MFLVLCSFYQRANLPNITLPYIRGPCYNSEVYQPIKIAHGRHGDKLERKCRNTDRQHLWRFVYMDTFWSRALNAPVFFHLHQIWSAVCWKYYENCPHEMPYLMAKMQQIKFQLELALRTPLKEFKTLFQTPHSRNGQERRDDNSFNSGPMWRQRGQVVARELM